jgi:hypothetical protein
MVEQLIRQALNTVQAADNETLMATFKTPKWAWPGPDE